MRFYIRILNQEFNYIINKLNLFNLTKSTLLFLKNY